MIPIPALSRTKGIHIISTDNIRVYAYATDPGCTDATYTLQTNALESNYIIHTYPSDVQGSECMIVAAEDSVTVNIHLSSATIDGHNINDTFLSDGADTSHKYFIVNTAPCYHDKPRRKSEAWH